MTPTQRKNPTKADIRAGREAGFRFQKDLIANRIKEVLASSRISDIAAKLSVSRNTLYAWMAGNSLPDLPRLAVFAAITGTSLGWLVTGKGSQRCEDAALEGYVTPDLDFGFETAPNSAPVAFEKAWLAVLAREFYAAADNPDFRPYLFRVRDDSMEPTVRRTDLLLISRRGLVVGRRATHGRAVELLLPRDGLWLFDAGQIWRVQWIPDADTFSASIRKDNRLYGSEPRTLTHKELPLVVGPVVIRIGQI